MCTSANENYAGLTFWKLSGTTKKMPYISKIYSCTLINSRLYAIKTINNEKLSKKLFVGSYSTK